MAYIDEALKLIEYGLAVFPLNYRAKEPSTKNGFKDATTDAEQVREWWTEQPFANIGIATGSISGGLLVVDIDIDDEKGIDGQNSLRKWEKEHGSLPETASTITGRGGNHYLFRTSGESKSRIGCLEGIDIKGDGGYIVAPPSIHPNGNYYEWECDIDEYGIQPVSDSVIDLMKLGAEKEGQSFIMPEKVNDGERNDILFRAASSLQSKGMSDKAIRSALKVENLEKCDPPLEDPEVEAIIKNVTTRYEKGVSLKDKRTNKEITTIPQLKSFSISDLRKMDPQPPDFIVDGMFPVGLGILAGKSKAGKSWMVLDLALSVAGGSKFLNKQTNKNAVFYMALEDSPHRILSRMDKVLGGRKDPERFYWTTEAEPVNKGLFVQLNNFLDDHSDIKLVIIDTMQKVRPESKQKDTYASDYDWLSELHNIALRRNICVLLVHHANKSSGFEPDTPFDRILGSTALQGATDYMYLISTKNGSSTLYGTGRDFESIEMAVYMNWDEYRWINLGSPEDVERDNMLKGFRKDGVMQYMVSRVKEFGIWEGSPSELMKDIKENTGFSFETPNKFGMAISKYDDVLSQVGIVHESGRSGNSRKHIFRKI